MGRLDPLRRIEALDPETHFGEIYRLHAQYEFPWEILDHGLAGRGRYAVRRINRIHARYAITNEDYLYVLSTFVVVPLRWLDRYGWRRVSEAERRATFLCYREIGRHMGITGIPASYDELAAFSDAYEREHFRYSDGSRRTAEATRELLVSWFPRPLAPLTRRAATALLDPPLLDAFGFAPAPQWLVRGTDLPYGPAAGSSACSPRVRRRSAPTTTGPSRATGMDMTSTPSAPPAPSQPATHRTPTM